MSEIDWETVIDMFTQLTETLERIQWSMEKITEPDYFYATKEGQEKLDAVGMKLLAIGELLKKIDKKTNKTLLIQYPEVDWTGFMGLRDVIAHDYYNLNPVKIFDICIKEIGLLYSTVNQIVADLKKNSFVN
jgi:uncharacterized protein with HEPN domain